MHLFQITKSPFHQEYISEGRFILYNERLEELVKKLKKLCRDLYKAIGQNTFHVPITKKKCNKENEEIWIERINKSSCMKATTLSLIE